MLNTDPSYRAAVERAKAEMRISSINKENREVFEFLENKVERELP